MMIMAPLLWGKERTKVGKMKLMQNQLLILHFITLYLQNCRLMVNGHVLFANIPTSSILVALADPNRPDWSHSIIQTNVYGVKELLGDKVLIQKEQSNNNIQYSPPSKEFVANVLHLSSAQLWSARAAVAHVRLLQANEPSTLSLRDEARSMFELCKHKFCNVEKCTSELDRQRAAKVLLEYGLSEHHFDVNKKGTPFFQDGLQFAGLDVEVTGAEGRRIKYQQKAIAQMLVRAKPTVSVVNEVEKNSEKNKNIGKQFIDHQDETILLDKVKYVKEEEDNTHFELSILQQSTLQNEWGTSNEASGRMAVQRQ